MILRIKCSSKKSSPFSGRVYFNFELLKTFLDDQKKSLAPEFFFISTVFDLHFSTGSNYLHAGSMAEGLDLNYQVGGTLNKSCDFLTNNYSESLKDEYVPLSQGRLHDSTKMEAR